MNPLPPPPPPSSPPAPPLQQRMPCEAPAEGYLPREIQSLPHILNSPPQASQTPQQPQPIIIAITPAAAQSPQQCTLPLSPSECPLACTEDTPLQDPFTAFPQPCSQHPVFIQQPFTQMPHGRVPVVLIAARQTQPRLLLTNPQSPMDSVDDSDDDPNTIVFRASTSRVSYRPKCLRDKIGTLS